MNRRTFCLASSFAALATAADPAPATSLRIASSTDEIPKGWGAFVDLAHLFEQLAEAFDPISDRIDGMRFELFLYEIGRPLSTILTQKGEVLTALSLTDCTRGGRGLTKAEEAAMSIGPLLQNLADQTEQLETAVKPKGLQDEIEKVSNDLRLIQYSKETWLPRVDSFCALNISDQAVLLAEVRQSMAAVDTAQKALDNLQDKIRSEIERRTPQ